MAFLHLAKQNIFQPILGAVKKQSQTSPRRARLAWTILGLTVFLGIAGLPLWSAFHTWNVTQYNLPYSAGVSMLIAALDMLAVMALALLGAVIVFAQPGNSIGWLLSGFVLIISLSGLCENYAVYAYVIAPERDTPLSELALWLQNWLWIPGVALPTIALPLLFPDGHLLSRRWKWLTTWAIGVIGFLSFLMALHPDAPTAGYFLDLETGLSNPYGIAALPSVLGLLINPLWAVSLLTMLIAWTSLIVRYRLSDYATRHQIKWFVFGLGLVITLFVMRNFTAYAPASLLEIAFQLSIVSLPVTLGISILKYRLYDIDILINRTLVYGLLTTSIAGLYVLIVGILSQIFQTSGDLFVSLFATGVVAISFHSLRERLQRLVNRLMFGQRDDPNRILSQLGRQVNTETTAESLLPTITQTISLALKLPYAAIRVRQSDENVTQASYGEAKTPTHTIPLIYQNEQVGELVAGLRSPHEPLNSADQRILEDIARQIGAVVHAARLTSDLQRSRERLVTAREEERRRLRRDLHDELGPALASHTLKLDAAIDLVETAPEMAIKLLTQVKTQSQALVTDVRRLVYDLRPPALDELGLLAALRSHIPQLMPNQKGLNIIIDTPAELPRLSAAVEVAVYRIAQEATLNVIKHAHAQLCTLRLSYQAMTSCLQIEVIDDGVGLPQPVISGVGLQSMRERAEELGGRFTAKTGMSGGTHLYVQLPVTLEGARS
jgi:signal transduction histidine kinase